MPPEWAALTVEKQLSDPDSTLSLFRRAIELRRTRVEFDGSRIEWLATPRDALIFRCPAGLICALNAGDRPLTLPDGELLLASASLVDGKLSPNAAAWLV
ncbi:putative oligo-1,6-glucosidase domain protein [Mycobacterium xenopi 4042]|nr:putative oligo-1,6-glucosidase domain protein [Mycobacterium xenopi 4042]